MNRTAKYIVISAAVSAAATLVAVGSYLVTAGASASELFALALPFSISPIIRGLPIAAAIGLILSRLTHLSSLFFVLAAVLLSATGGATVAVLATRTAVHVSTSLATALAAVVWAIAAGVSAAICIRAERLQPNFTMKPTRGRFVVRR